MEENQSVDTKKKMSKGKKITLITVCSVLAVIILVVAIVLGVLLNPGGSKEPTIVTGSQLNVQMLDQADPTGATLKYYVGNANDLDLTKAFPGAKNFKGAGAASNKIAAGAAVNGETLTFKNANGNEASYKIYSVDAYNVFGDTMESDMRTKLKEGVNVVMHENLTTKDAQSFSFYESATLYGNGHVLNAHSICAPKDQKKSKKTSWGAHVLRVGDGKSLHVQDLHVLGNYVEEGQPIVLENFEFSGNVVDIDTSLQENGEYAESTITNCILENGQKIIHVHGSNLKIEGSIIRQGADANIATGTTGAKKGSKITVKNTISADSMVAGFLFYGYEDVPADDVKSQQTLDVQGFFDIYNWKTTTTAKLVPATENIGPIKVADIVNGNVQKEVSNPSFADFLYPIGDIKYVHIGIIKLATGGCMTQNPTITYEGKDELPPQYAAKSFPLPGWVKSIGIVKSCSMVAYKNMKDFADGEKPYVMPGAKVPTDAQIYKDLAFGRK